MSLRIRKQYDSKAERFTEGSPASPVVPAAGEQERWIAVHL